MKKNTKLYQLRKDAQYKQNNNYIMKSRDIIT